MDKKIKEIFDRINDIYLKNEFDNVETIVTHPGNQSILTKTLEKHSPEGIHYINPIKVRYDENLEQFKQEGWTRGPVLPNGKFVQWVTEEELKNPTSWQIYFKLVVPRLVPNFYFINKSRVAIYTPNFFPIMDKRRILYGTL
jgi:hypothetical protein